MTPKRNTRRSIRKLERRTFCKIKGMNNKCPFKTANIKLEVIYGLNSRTDRHLYPWLETSLGDGQR